MKRRIVNLMPERGPVAQVQDGTANIFVFGEISDWWGFNKDQVTSALRGKSYENVNVYISSPGGDISEAFVIHDLLKGTRANVTAYLTGICASAATVIACAANRVVMSQACVYMVHKPAYYGSSGDAAALRKDADILDTYEDIILNLYAARTGKGKRMLADLVQAETWMGPKEARDLGFVDEIADSIEIDWTASSSGLSSGGWDSWMWDNADGNRVFNGQKVYRSSVVNLIEKGFRQYGVEANSSTENFTIMNFAQKVIAFLTGKDLIAADKREAAENALMEMDLVQAVESAAEAKFAVVTQAGVLNAIRSMTPEQRAELFPRNVTAEGGEPDTDISMDDSADRIAQLEQQIAELQEQLTQVQNVAAAAASRRTVPVAPTNGKTKANEPAAKTSNLLPAQLEMTLQGFRGKRISAAVFTSITGMTPEEAAEHLRAAN